MFHPLLRATHPCRLLVGPGEPPSLGEPLLGHDLVEDGHGLVDVIVLHHHCSRYPLKFEGDYNFSGAVTV